MVYSYDKPQTSIGIPAMTPWFEQTRIFIREE